MLGKTKQIAKANPNNDQKKRVEVKMRKLKYGQVKINKQTTPPHKTGVKSGKDT